MVNDKGCKFKRLLKTDLKNNESKQVIYRLEYFTAFGKEDILCYQVRVHLRTTIKSDVLLDVAFRYSLKKSNYRILNAIFGACSYPYLLLSNL